jgi:hypothetical protein
MTNDTRRIDDTVVDDEDPSWIHKDEATVAEGLRRWRRHIDALVDGYDLDDIEIDQTAGAWFKVEENRSREADDRNRNLQ